MALTSAWAAAASPFSIFPPAATCRCAIEDRTVWITYNGEIYNFAELRRELENKGHRFASHTDTEVVLHLYEEEGPDCVKRLNGMFAFAICDLRSAIADVCFWRATTSASSLSITGHRGRQIRVRFGDQGAAARFRESRPNSIPNRCTST